MKAKIITLTSMLTLTGITHTAQASTAQCLITSGKTTTYKGKCSFNLYQGGSFSIAPVGKRTFDGENTSISLDIMEKNKGDVRGLTTGGINARWGEVVRQKKQSACWVGVDDDFKICVW